MKYNKTDFKVSFTTGTGPGGQHRNKVATTAIVTHIPTGLTQRCGESRSQRSNLQKALKALISKLESMKEKDKHEKLNSIRKTAITGETIRTYNYKRGEVKDHRNGKVAPLSQVLDGHIELLH